MKKWLTVIVMVLVAHAMSTCAYAEEALQGTPLISAKAYAVMDVDTGELLLERSAYQSENPASTTKIFTMAMAYDRFGSVMADTPVEVSESAINVPYDSSLMGICAGEHISIQDAYYGTFLVSGNDAANVLAEAIGGTPAAGVARINSKAKEIGCVNTHFENAHGYYAANHYTCAYDLALVTRWGLQINGFKETLACTDYTVNKTNIAGERILRTANLMQQGQTMQYDGLIGGKSGWVPEAGYCQVQVAERAGRTLIVVVLGASGYTQKFLDCATLLDAGFNTPSQKHTEVSTELVIPERELFSPVITNTITLDAGIKAGVFVPDGTKYVRLYPPVPYDHKRRKIA